MNLFSSVSRIFIRIGNRFAIVKELLHFFRTEKQWWLAPFVLTLFVISGLLVFIQYSAPIIPFLYTVF